jgi:hypothetical protein
MRVAPFLICFYTLFLFSVHAQTENQMDYRSPLDIPTALTAGFGEIRPNHFHMGLDFRTSGREGLKIRAVDRGYISRIVVSPQGYGKVLYINHPNGVTSVYAHCSDFNTRIDSLVSAIQFRYKANEIDIRLSPDEIPVIRGEQIAFSGNTGNSSGPHLHFELRDTESQDALNPLTHGFFIADHQAPKIQSIKLYAVTPTGFTIPGKEMVIRPNQFDTLHLPSNFCSEHGGIGFAVEGTDYTDKSVSSLGIHGVEISSGQELISGFTLDRISFDVTRMVNAHCDHAAYGQHGSRYHKCFHSDTDPLSIYTDSKKNGVFTISPGKNYPIQITSLDAAKNKTEFSFVLSVDQGPMHQTNYYTESYLYPNENIVVKKDNCQISIPALAVISPLNISEWNNEVNSIGFPILNRAINVSFPLTARHSEHAKYYIEVTMSDGKKRFLKTFVGANDIHASSTYSGIFNLKIDERAPSVSALNFISNQTITKNTLTWRVKETETALRFYELEVDGKWMPVYYDSKNDVLEFSRPTALTGTFPYRLRVQDWCGNETILEGIFVF